MTATFDCDHQPQGSQPGSDEDYKVPFAAGLARDGTIHIYVDEDDSGLRIIRGDAGTGIMIETPTPLKAMDPQADKLNAIREVIRTCVSVDCDTIEAIDLIKEIIEDKADATEAQLLEETAAVKEVWLKWKADDATAWQAITEIGAILGARGA